MSLLKSVLSGLFLAAILTSSSFASHTTWEGEVYGHWEQTHWGPVLRQFAGPFCTTLRENGCRLPGQLVGTYQDTGYSYSFSSREYNCDICNLNPPRDGESRFEQEQRLAREEQDMRNDFEREERQRRARIYHQEESRDSFEARQTVILAVALIGLVVALAVGVHLVRGVDHNGLDDFDRSYNQAILPGYSRNFFGHILDGAGQYALLANLADMNPYHRRVPVQ
ncbi:MAG: hypothetical protein KA436_01960 [Oligoflexales bacterium]|nr:hypothetical protein [Oligoflexales bacterium]